MARVADVRDTHATNENGKRARDIYNTDREVQRQEKTSGEKGD